MAQWVESTCSAGDEGSIPGSGRCPGEDNGNLLQYSRLQNPVDRGAWQATPCKVSQSWTAKKKKCTYFMNIVSENVLPQRAKKVPFNFYHVLILLRLDKILLICMHTNTHTHIYIFIQMLSCSTLSP